MPLSLLNGRLARWLRRGAIVLATTAALWLILSLIVAYRLTHRRRPPFPEPVPTWADMAVEEHRLKTNDGESIGAWFADGPNDWPTVLLLHANGGSRTSSVSQARIFASAGYAVLLISLRGHGDSSGNYHDLGFSARHDVLAAVAFLEDRHPGRPVIIFGTSLGSAAAVFAATELGHRVAGYILECPYRDLKTAVWNRTNLYLPPALSQTAYVGLRAVGPLFLPHLDDISLLKTIRGIPNDVPVLILAGAADRLARSEEADALYNAVASHGKLVVFPNGGHAKLAESDPELFNRTILEFCEQIRLASPPLAGTRP